MMRIRKLWLSLGALVLAITPVGAAVIRVPADQPTILAGLDASVAGDSVLVAPGTYSDVDTRVIFGFPQTACAFLVDGVTLISEGGPTVTTIDMQGATGFQPQVVYGERLLSGDTVVEGFTLTGAPVGSPGAFIVDSEKVTLRDCVLRDMDGAQLAVAGILATYADLDIIRCEFRNLSSQTGGAGIHQLEADLLVDGCLFTNCVERAIGTHAQDLLIPEQAVIRNSTFIGNSASSGGGGGAVSIVNYQSGVTVSDCHFEDNVIVAVGGAVQIGGAQVGPWTVANCVFWKNRATSAGGGGGALATGFSGTVVGNTFHQNTAFGTGSAAVLQVGVVDFRNNIVTGSSGTAAVTAFSATVVPSCNVYWQNAGGDVSGFSMAATDRVIDPQYCDPTLGDFTVFDTSPCLPANTPGCGQIGARGRGCGSVSVETRSWGRIKEGYR
ncbi:MAG: right-handed parallel beta-helix repeat-containing protein [Candidatus Eiseniibacteriota bacterium]